MAVFKINRENYNIIFSDTGFECIKSEDANIKIVVNYPDIKKVINTYDGFKGGVIQLNLGDRNLELFTYDEIDYNNFLDKIHNIN
jgi:hypothetical protein